MEDITSEQVRVAINAFLTEQYNKNHKKTEKEQKQLIKAEDAEDLSGITELKEILEKSRQKYQLDTWMEKAANWMTTQISFGTHISKGVHSSSKGDNVNFSPKTALPEGLVGHQSLKNVMLDASGNAAGLPLASFFEFYVDESRGIKIKDLIISESKALIGNFSTNKDVSDLNQNRFKNSLDGIGEEVKNCESNKQVLWPLDFSGANYSSLTPLYPIILSHNLYTAVVDIKSSRKDKIQNKEPYRTFNDLGLVKIGGTNPQGVSRLMKKQNGRNYLIPSLPPKFTQNKKIKVSPFANSIFDKALNYRCREIFSALVRLINTQYNNVNIRNARKAILDDLLYEVLATASTLQDLESAGWSIDFALNYSEKLWLDPNRGDLEGQEQFKNDRENSNWREDISKRFANWVNATLKAELKHIKNEFADAEYKEWQKEMDQMIAQSQRQGQGVFL